MPRKSDPDGIKKKTYNKKYYSDNKNKLLQIQKERAAYKIKNPFVGPIMPPEIFAIYSKEKNITYKKQWGIDNKERLAEKRKAQYAAERDEAIRKAIEWNQNNPERRKKIIREYEKNNPDQVRSNRHNRRVRENSAKGTWSKGDIIEMFNEQNGLCAIGLLPLPEKFDVDHIIPLALGGYNGRPNLQLTCPYCNRRKGAKHPDIFAKLPFKPCKT